MKTLCKIISAFLSVLFVFYAMPAKAYASNGQDGISAPTPDDIMTQVTEAEAAEATAVGEITELRTANTKTVRMSDGSFKLVSYGNAVHYEQNGVWHEYDNSLTAEAKLGVADFNGYRTTNNNIGIKLGADSSDKALSLSDGNHALSFSVMGGKSVAASIIPRQQHTALDTLQAITEIENYSQSLVYPNIFPGVSFEYTVSGSDVKENIIVAKKADEYSYSFYIETTALTATATDGGISFRDSVSGAEIYTIPAGYMYDADGNRSDAVSYTLTATSAGKYTLTVTADTDWINAAGRKLPVVIDPTVEYNNHGLGWTIKDTQIHSDQTEPNNGEQDLGSMRAGIKNGAQYNALIGLTDSIDVTNIPRSSIITDATLTLFCTGFAGSPTVTAHEITADWTASTVTWLNKPAYSDTVVDFQTIDHESEANNPASTYTFNITSLVQKWFNGSDEDDSGEQRGLLLKADGDTSGGNNYAAFSTANHEQRNNYPLFTISYRDSKGIESRFSYSSQSAGEGGSGHVNLLTGNLVFVRDDIAANGNILPITVSHVFNTHSKDVPSNVGMGWQLSLDETVETTRINGEDRYKYRDSDGTVLYFHNFQGGSTYYSEDGYSLKIVKSTGGYTMTDDSGNTKHFNPSGKVDYVTDTFGNRRDFVYNSDGLLASISYTPQGETTVTQLSFEYNSEKALKRINNCQDSGEYVTFKYSDEIDGSYDNTQSTYLRSITHSKGKECLYTYNADGTLKTATDGESGAYLEYSYKTDSSHYTALNSPVSAVTEYTASQAAGQGLLFDYGTKQTKVQNSGNDDVINTADDIKTVYIFDNHGRAVSSYSTNKAETEIYGAANAEYTVAGAGDKSQHKITKDSVAGAYAKNLIVGASAEASSGWSGIRSGDAYASSHSTDNAFVGTHSIKLTSTSSSGFAGRTQSFTVSTEDTYTLSAYIKAENFTSGTGGVYVDFYNSSYVKNSRVIRANTSTSVQNGWQRLSVTATLPAGTYQARIVLVNKVGTAYADCMQLEKATAASSYNLMGNLRSGTTSVTGNYTGTAGFTETLPVNKSADTTFVLSGWAKANSVAITGDDRNFGLAAVITYSDGTAETVETAFTPDNPDWQYTSTAVVAKEANKSKTISTIAVKTQYNNNANTAYFKDISLTMQPAQSYAYDSNGNLISLTDAENNTVSTTYADNGIDIASYTNIVGETYQYSYHADYSHVLSAITRTRGESTLQTQYTYDAFGNVIKIQTSAGSLTQEASATYDEYGKTLTSTSSNGNTTSYNYSSATELLEYVDNANGNRAAYFYDSRDRLTSVFLDADKDNTKDAAEAAVGYLYNNQGQLSTISTATTNYSFLYNSYGAETAVKAGGYTLATYSYNGNAGKPTATAYGNGFTTRNIYDHLDRVVEIRHNNITRYTIAYNGDGAVASITDILLSRVTDYEYDSLGRLIRAEEYNSQTGESILKTENKFDSFGRPLSSVYVTPNGTQTYTLEYKENSNLISRVIITDTATPQQNITIVMSYDNMDRLVIKSTLGASGLIHEYFNYIQIDGKTGSLINTHTINEDRYSYTYDSLGNIKKIYLNDVLQVSYTYDKLNQLSMANYTDEDIGAYEYFYDKAGNLTSQGHHYGPGTCYSDYISYSHDDNSWGDLLTEIDGTDITYDEIGNPENWRNATSLTWEGRNLVGATVNGTEFVFKYDSDGIRARKEYASIYVDYITDGTKILCENRYGVNFRSYYYDASGSPIGLSHGGDIYSFKKNSQGDIIGIYDELGFLVVEYTYDPYGNVLSQTGSEAQTVGNANPFLYRGYYFDRDLGWYYLNSRYYDPVVGRFINSDVIINANGGVIGYNLFAYCSNNPVNFIDEYGMAYGPHYFPDPGEVIPNSFTPYSATPAPEKPFIPDSELKAMLSPPNEVLQDVHDKGFSSPPRAYCGQHVEGQYVVHRFNEIDSVWSSRYDKYIPDGVVIDYYFKVVDNAAISDSYDILSNRLSMASNILNVASDPLFAMSGFTSVAVAAGIVAPIVQCILNHVSDVMFKKSEYYDNRTYIYELDYLIIYRIEYNHVTMEKQYA